MNKLFSILFLSFTFLMGNAQSLQYKVLFQNTGVMVIDNFNGYNTFYPVGTNSYSVALGATNDSSVYVLNANDAIIQKIAYRFIDSTQFYPGAITVRPLWTVFKVSFNAWSNVVNTFVDSIYKKSGTDSIFYNKAGVPIYAFRDGSVDTSTFRRVFVAAPLNSTPQALYDQAGNSSALRIGTTSIAVGASTGAGILKLPDAGSTSADGIAFGTEHFIYRANSGRLFVSPGSELWLTSASTTVMTTSSTAITAYKPIRFSSTYINPGMGASIAAATNLPLGVDGNVFTVTAGATTIDNFILPAGATTGYVFWLQFTGGVTLKTNTGGGGGTKVLLHGGVDKAVTGNDVVMFIYNGTNILQAAPVSEN